MTVYRETKDGPRYIKVQEYGEESGKRAGMLWKKMRVYEVIWEKEGEVRESAAGEGGNDEKGRGAPTRSIVGSNIEQSVTYNDSTPSTYGAGRVGSTEENDVEQQRKAAWAWKRREDALEGARERTGDGMLGSTWTGRMSTRYGPCYVYWRTGRVVRKSRKR